MRSMLILLLFLTLTAPALASDGVIEINQTCAVQTGCIDNSGGIGDTPGFPVTIEIPGSYVLTSNLVVSEKVADTFCRARSLVSASVPSPFLNRLA